jgi:antibiotic biosynthesis monooxygenase (ABM) superfamily enzyme
MKLRDVALFVTLVGAGLTAFDRALAQSVPSGTPAPIVVTRTSVSNRQVHVLGSVVAAGPSRITSQVRFLAESQLQFTRQGPKLVGVGGVGGLALQGLSVSLSADGNTAIAGGPADSNNTGAAWIWTRLGGAWTQQQLKLIGSGAVGHASQGFSVALSADGNTAIIGGPSDNGNAGAAWIWTRNGGVWTQQGSKLVGSGPAGIAQQGYSVALSADGNTAVVGANQDNNFVGAIWIWTRSGGVWTQQGSKLVGSGAVGNASQGCSVSLAGDGNTAVVGGQGDNSYAGAAWIWTRSGGVWTQQGSKLVGSGVVGNANQGYSVSLGVDGNTVIVGGPTDDGGAGAAWAWIRSAGVWTQQGGKLVGTGAAGTAQQGYSVSIASAGNTAMIGGNLDDNFAGAAWVWTRSGGVWTQQGAKLVGSGAEGSGAASQGASGDNRVPNWSALAPLAEPTMGTDERYKAVLWRSPRMATQRSWAARPMAHYRLTIRGRLGFGRGAQERGLNRVASWLAPALRVCKECPWPSPRMGTSPSSAASKGSVQGRRH